MTYRNSASFVVRLKRALYAPQLAQELNQSEYSSILHEEARYSAFRKRVADFEIRCQRLQDKIEELKADCELGLTPWSWGGALTTH